MSLDKITKKAQQLLAMQEREIVVSYRERLKEIRELMLAQYEKYGTAGSLSIDDMLKYDRIDTLDAKIIKIVRGLYKENSLLTRSILRETYKQTYSNTMALARAESGKKIRGILKTVDVTETINERMGGLKWAERFGRHRNELIFKIQSEVKDGLQKGISYSEMAGNLREAMQGDVIRPTTIMRTEGGRVMAKAQKNSLDHAEAQGVAMEKTWNTSKDERVRGNNPGDVANHVEMEGQTVPYDEPFILPDGVKADAPRLTGVARHDINCRCFMTVKFI